MNYCDERELLAGEQEAGFYEITRDATNHRGVKIADGIYYYQISTKNHEAVKKITLLK